MLHLSFNFSSLHSRTHLVFIYPCAHCTHNIDMVFLFLRLTILVRFFSLLAWNAKKYTTASKPTSLSPPDGHFPLVDILRKCEHSLVEWRNERVELKRRKKLIHIHFNRIVDYFMCKCIRKWYSTTTYLLTYLRTKKVKTEENNSNIAATQHITCLKKSQNWW